MSAVLVFLTMSYENCSLDQVSVHLHQQKHEILPNLSGFYLGYGERVVAPSIAPLSTYMHNINLSISQHKLDIFLRYKVLGCSDFVELFDDI